MKGVSAMSQDLNRLLKRKLIEKCTICDGFSAYRAENVDENLNIELLSRVSTNEFTCGHCGQSVLTQLTVKTIDNEY